MKWSFFIIGIGCFIIGSVYGVQHEIPISPEAWFIVGGVSIIIAAIVRLDDN